MVNLRSTSGDGTIAPANLAGWIATGAYGVNAAGGSFADNGAIPDQDNVAFLQGPGSLSQTVSGLVTGATYQVSFAYNAKSGAKPHLQAKVGEAVLFEEDVNLVGGTNPRPVRRVGRPTSPSTTPTRSPATSTSAGPWHTRSLVRHCARWRRSTCWWRRAGSCHPRTRAIPVVVVSAVASTLTDDERGLVQAVLPKPFTIDRLVETIRSVQRTGPAGLTS